MVQMKGFCPRGEAKPFLKLYIPHGSDESTEEECQSYKECSFISHMVQMKVLTNQ